MIISVGWDPADWQDNHLGRIVTCVGVDDRAVPYLTNTAVAPPNTGSLTLDLTLPDGPPGSLVCGQSLLVGQNGAEGRNRTTSPVCFKLRAPEPAAPPARTGGRRIEMSPSPSADATTPAIRPAPSPQAPGGPPAPGPGPVPRLDPASTPPARAAFEAAARPSAGRMAGARPDETARRGIAVAATTASAASAPARPDSRAARTAQSAAAAAAQPAAIGAPAAALPRTGLDNHLPLAGAGGLLALGGASIIFGQPRRRRV